MDFHARQARGPESDCSDRRAIKYQKTPMIPASSGENAAIYPGFHCFWTEATTTARQLYDAMLELYPDRVNPGLALGCRRQPRKEGRRRGSYEPDFAMKHRFSTRKSAIAYIG